MTPIPTRAAASAATPARTSRLITLMPLPPTSAQIRTSPIPVITIAPAVGSIPSTVSAHGAPR
jgi:hypothetical protein